MVALHLLDSEPSNSLGIVKYPESGRSLIDPDSVIFTSRRPALVPHVDPAVNLVKRLILLPYHILVPSSQYYALTVKLAEGVTFPREARIPKSIYVEVQAGQQIHTYAASVTLTAKLRGLRWILHNYRLPAFITLTLGFWSVEMLFAALALFFIGMAMRPSDRPDLADGNNNSYPHLGPPPDQGKGIEGPQPSGSGTPLITAASAKRFAENDSGESSGTSNSGGARRRRIKEEAGPKDELSKTLREDTDDEPEDVRIKEEAEGTTEDEEFGKSLSGDTEEETKIKVEDDSDN